MVARKYDVTRTIENTKVVALVFNKTTAEAENLTIVVAGRYELVNKKLTKLVTNIVETDDNYKFIEIVDMTSETKTYGITLNDFMANAVELDPKTRQPVAG